MGWVSDGSGSWSGWGETIMDLELDVASVAVDTNKMASGYDAVGMGGEFEEAGLTQTRAVLHVKVRWFSRPDK